MRAELVEEVDDDIHRASYGRREEQKADGQPEEAARTFKRAFGF